MARPVPHIGVMIALLLAQGPAASQTLDRARDLQARQAARLQQREAARASVFGIDPYGVGSTGCDPHSAFGGIPGANAWTRTPGWPGERAGCRAPGWAASGYGYFDGYGAYPGTGWYGPGSGGGPYGLGYGYGILPSPPNPYRDWARLWGRGWLDGEAVPPYHRFQYRFYPETLPDPTRQGYVTAQEWYGQPTARPMPMPAAPDCVRVELDLGGRAPEVFAVRLPTLGAGTSDALESVMRDRLGRGGGVVLRAYDGHVVRLPPAESIRSLAVSPCAAPPGR